MMSKIKVLYLTIDRDTRVANHFDDFRNAFCKYVDVTILKQKIFKHTPNDQHTTYLTGEQKYNRVLTGELDYDCIICDSLFLWMFEDWSMINIPTLSIIEDQHNKVPKIQVDYAVKHNHVIIHRYQFKKFHTDLPSHIRTFWSPHSVNVNIFLDWDIPVKKYGVLLSGAMYPIYKTRNEVLNSLIDEPYFKHLIRPKDYVSIQWPVGADYSRELNKAWLSVCCGSTYQYPIRKYMEIPASKSVLYADYFPELQDLGFIPDENMIIVDKNNIKGQCVDLFKNKKKLNRIAENGYNLIHDRHTDDIRCVELLNFIKKIIK